MLKAHRVALIFRTGQDLPTKEAGHSATCTTTLCCNPAHLRWVTRAENLADWIAKHSTKELIRLAVQAALEC